MQRLIAFLFILTFSINLNAQPDSLKPVLKIEPHFENFFGSDCEGDTLIRQLFTRSGDSCRLVRRSLLLERFQKNKTRWKTELKQTPDGISLWNPCLLLFEKKWIVVQAYNLSDTVLYTIWIEAKNGKIRKIQSKPLD